MLSVKNMFVGFYIYAEASWPRKKGDKARIASGFIRPTHQGDTSCRLRFYYHVLGSDIGKINVYTRPCNGCAEALVFTKAGSVGNYYVRTEVILQRDKPFQVMITFVGYRIFRTITRIYPHRRITRTLIHSFIRYVSSHLTVKA